MTDIFPASTQDNLHATCMPLTLGCVALLPLRAQHMPDRSRSQPITLPALISVGGWRKSIPRIASRRKTLQAASPGFDLESVALARTECMPNGQDPKYRLQTPFACRSQEHIADLLASNVVNSSTPVYLSNCCLWTTFDASRRCLGMSAGMKGWQFDPCLLFIHQISWLR